MYSNYHKLKHLVKFSKVSICLAKSSPKMLSDLSPFGNIITSTKIVQKLFSYLQHACLHQPHVC